MIEAVVYNEKGEKAGKQKLSSDLFEVPFRDEVIYDAVLFHLANRRRNYAHTKGRGDRRGGGIKPWRQKGTGRARHGSIRSPIWRKGGVTFGPTKEVNFSKKLNRKVRRAALLMALSRRAADGGIVVLESLKMDKPSTKKLAGLIKKMKLDESVQIVFSKMEKKVFLSGKNIPGLSLVDLNGLNAYDVLRNGKIVFLKDGLLELERIYKGAIEAKTKS